MFTVEFWRKTGERAVKTFAQSLSASLMIFTGINKVDWLISLSGALFTTLLSVLTSIGSAAATGEDTPDLTK